MLSESPSKVPSLYTLFNTIASVHRMRVRGVSEEVICLPLWALICLSSLF